MLPRKRPVNNQNNEYNSEISNLDQQIAQIPTDCRHFSGYKPCGFSDECHHECKHKDIPKNRILIIHLGALGAVLRATCILEVIKKKYHSSHITWITDKPGNQLLTPHPLIDKVITSDLENIIALGALEFDVAFVIDKSLKAMGVLSHIKTDMIFGFKNDPRSGAIIPATAAAIELWNLGLSNQKKFFQNKKSEVQLLIESLELGPFNNNEYSVFLTQEEVLESKKLKLKWAPQNEIIIGFNTGCSYVIPHKKLTVKFQKEIIDELFRQYGFHENPKIKIVLLGGPEDTIRNKEIAELNPKIINSETENGLRKGLISVNACDIIFTGDSLGMHMAIGLKKSVIAWFGPTCSQEIELYGRGQKIETTSGCNPCWKRECHKEIMCYDQVDKIEIIKLLKNEIEKIDKNKMIFIKELNF
jgi:heptosyltransferase-2